MSRRRVVRLATNMMLHVSVRHSDVNGTDDVCKSCSLIILEVRCIQAEQHNLPQIHTQYGREHTDDARKHVPHACTMLRNAYRILRAATLWSRRARCALQEMRQRSARHRRSTIGRAHAAVVGRTMLPTTIAARRNVTTAKNRSSAARRRSRQRDTQQRRHADREGEKVPRFSQCGR
mgnify:CR=1 FL=1